MTSWWQHRLIWNSVKLVQKQVNCTNSERSTVEEFYTESLTTLFLGNYPQALDDFQECLTLQLKHLPPHSRLLAETHYHVATTLVSMDQYNQAIQHYNSSIKVIETRLGMDFLLPVACTVAISVAIGFCSSATTVYGRWYDSRWKWVTVGIVAKFVGVSNVKFKGRV